MKHLIALILISFAAAAHADGDDQDRAREAYEHHEIMPLAKILAAVKRTYGNNVVDIEFEDHKGQKVYEFEIIDPSGQVIEVVIDAATGKRVGNEEEKD